MSQELDVDFFWIISRMKNFDENNLLLLLDILMKYDAKPWSPNRISIMKDLIQAQYTVVKELNESNLELMDKRFQSHVSPIFALGLGIIRDDGTFLVSEIGKVLHEKRDTEEFMLIQMSRWQLPNGSIRVKEKLRKWINRERCVIPFILILRVMLNLYDYSINEAYLTNEEIVKFIMPLKSHEENVENTIQNLLSTRAQGLTIKLSKRERERAIEDLKILLSYHPPQ